MATNLKFILNAIINISQTAYFEGLEEGIITIQGVKNGLLKKEVIKILIKRSKTEPDLSAFMIADINGIKQSGEVPKEILYDILTKTKMLDNKLKMKLDIVFNERKLRVENGKLIID